MSNYTQTTFFAPKDALPPGNPAKTIFGAAYDTEFGNLSVAITSKQDQFFFADTGVVNAMVITPSPPYGGYTTGMIFSVKVASTNTATPVTLNVNGLGPKNVTNPDTSGVTVGQLQVGMIVEVMYDGAQFQIQSGQLTKFFGVVSFAPAGTTVFKVLGTTAPTIQGFGPTAAALVDMTPDTGTFSGSFAGFVGGPLVATVTWQRIGTLCTILFPTVQGTSNSTTFSMTGLPAIITPATFNQRMNLPSSNIIDNGNPAADASVGIQNTGSVTFFKAGLANTWTNGGTKGFTPNNVPITYSLQ